MKKTIATYILGVNAMKIFFRMIFCLLIIFSFSACASKESKTANESFRGNMEIMDSSGNVLFTTSDLEFLDTSKTKHGEFVVDISLNDDAIEKLEEVTKSQHGDTLNIYVDEKPLASYTIEDQVTDGHIQIGGYNTWSEAYETLMAIKNGIRDEDIQTNEPSASSQMETYVSDEENEEEITLVKIQAEYTGDDEAGVVIGSDLDDIDVICTYSDGTTEEIYDGFSVKKTATLKPNKTSTITITYKGKQCKLKVKCSTKKKHRKGKNIIGISNKDMHDIDGSFRANKVRNDVTGNWRISTIAANVNMEKYALSYYEWKFYSDDEIHGIVNFNYNTTTKISVMGNMLDVTVHEYVKGEEHDANLLFSGMVLKEYHVYLDNGDIKKIQ